MTDELSHIIKDVFHEPFFGVVGAESLCAFSYKGLNIKTVMYLIISSNAGRVARSGRRGLGSGQ